MPKSIDAQSGIPCPTCRRGLQDDIECPRCGTDVTTLQALRRHAESLTASARIALRNGDPETAETALRQAAALYQPAADPRWSIVAKLLRRDYPAALADWQTTLPGTTTPP